MFRINSQDIEIDFPHKGININAENDISYAKFIQNILIADNKTGCLRYGTDLVSSFQIDPELIFTEGKILEIMSFLGNDGIAQKLIYVTYFKKISNINNFDLKIYDYPALTGWSKAIINLNEINLEDKNYLKKTINDSLKILFIGNGSLSTEIKLINFDDNNIQFIFSIEKEDIPSESSSVLVDPDYNLYIERAGIYKINNENEYELLKDELDPLVIVSNINFQGKLIIANGVDPVQIYDGQEISPLYGPIGIPNLNEISVEDSQLKFKVPVAGAILMQEDIKIGDKLTIRRQEISDEEVIINSINYGEILNEEREVTIILDNAPAQQPISTILYQKLCPSFSYINVVYRRLFALAPGRTYLNKFKPADSSMKVYYAAKEERINEWFNQKTNSIEFIDLANSSRIPDNLEAITTFYGKTLFLGREEIQVWGGQDPTTHDDGQNISLPDFAWEQTLPIGLMHQKVFLHLPNQLVFLSKYGIVALGIASINGGLARFDINYQFSNPIDNYISYQLNFIETDRNFRNIKAFLYPYGRFFGFKIQYSCFIYQLNNLEGAWVVFSENFAESSSISYDVTTQNLYLGMPKGELLVYTDKINNRSFIEYGKGSIPWLINYNWNFLPAQWNNKYLYIFSKSLKTLVIDVRIYLDNNETKTINDKIKINQEGVLYDTAKFNSKIYPLNETSYSYELISFSVNSFMIELKGSSSDLFVFNKMFLVGGIN